MKKYWALKQSELYLLDQIIDTYMVDVKNDIDYKYWLFGYLNYNFEMGNIRVLLSYDDTVNSNINSYFLEDWTFLIINKNNTDESLGRYMGTVSGLMRRNKLKKIMKCE